MRAIVTIVAAVCAIGGAEIATSTDRARSDSVDTAIPFLPSIGLSGSWKTEADNLNKQLGLVNAHVSKLNTEVSAVRGDLIGLQTKIGQLESQIGAVQVALKAESTNVQGSQFLTGDVGYLTVIGVLFLAGVALVGYQKRRTMVLEQTNTILAASTSDDEAKRKAAFAHPAVAKAVEQAISKKNGGGV